MFESTNLAELRKIAQRIITRETVDEGKTWTVNEHQRKQMRRAMFGPGKHNGERGTLSTLEQKDLLNEFTKMIVDPMIESLPRQISAWTVLMLYEEFVDAVFIEPGWEADTGAGD